MDGSSPTEDCQEELTVEEVLECGIDRWYSRFRHVTFETKLLPLPAGVRAFLLSDGILLPPPTARDRAPGGDADSDGSGWGDGGSDSDDDEESKPVHFDFPDFEAAVLEAIEALGGMVMPKLNWSAPKDAKWLFNTLCCQTPHDVFTLLKASDFVVHDLCHSFDHCCSAATAAAADSKKPDTPTVDKGASAFEGAALALRRWRELDEAGEFRCFVVDGRIRAVSQRHSTLYFPHLGDAELKATLQRHIVAFFEESIRDHFTSRRYVLDVVVGKAPRYSVKLVDFSPWSSCTDPLLFDWDELSELCTRCSGPARQAGADEDAEQPELRVVEKDSERRSKLENYHCVPLELVELGSASPDEVESLCRRAELARAKAEANRSK